MCDSRCRPTRWLALVAALAAVVLGPALSADAAAVDVSFEVSGNAVPGGTVTVAATVDITDGSTLQSVTWSQVSGVPATLSGVNTNTVTAVLGPESAYKARLIEVLSEPPIGPDQLPPNVPVPPADEEFVGGLQNRFQLVATNPLALEHTAAVGLQLEVVTTSGTYDVETDVATTIPWTETRGIRNVPVGVRVLLHGKDQASYDWTLTPAAGSSATLADATTQDPEFTPDVAGVYEVNVTQLSDSSVVNMIIYAGTWKGVIVGEDADGRPIADPACLNCHNGSVAPDVFTPWAHSGHAEIFTQNIDDAASTHYGPSCFSCHTVGFNLKADNNGFDDQANYQAFLDANLFNNGRTDNWATMLTEFPDLARLANIQCENCHGPQNSPAHANGAPRVSLSSDLCGTCHGEPARHGRYQQWQLSGHANYELAGEEGTNSNCARCHSANGFIQWVTDFAADPDANVNVTWTADEVQPQSCQACHQPHDVGTTSGGPETNAKVRIMGNTPVLVAGFQATDVGKGAVCMTCHNSRRGLRNDATFDRSDAARATHPGPQADVLMGQNAYFVKVGTRGFHSEVEDTCVACHMEKTPPPASLSYELGGTNHTFYASDTICSDCHSVITAQTVQGPVEAKLEELKASVEAELIRLMGQQIALDRTIDLGGQATIADPSDIVSVDFVDYHGGQGMSVSLSDGMVVGPLGMTSVKVTQPSGGSFGLYDVADSRLPKAGWNYLLLEADGSKGVHNPAFANAILDASETAIKNLEAGIPEAAAPPQAGEGAVACMSSHVYWTEIAAHNQAPDGSTWKTDMITRNTTSSPADVEFILHTSSGDVTNSQGVQGGAQGVFEDVVGMMGVTGKGAMEICSDQPLEVVSRIFNQSDKGTYGQFMDGHRGGTGMAAGDSAMLLGLRQSAGAFRTNISVTNTGKDVAQVRITLYVSDGTELTSYDLTVGSGMVVQDLQPFKTRANRPDLGFGFALVEVVDGSGVFTSASVADDVTNDATTIPMKR